MKFYQWPWHLLTKSFNNFKSIFEIYYSLEYEYDELILIRNFQEIRNIIFNDYIIVKIALCCMWKSIAFSFHTRSHRSFLITKSAFCIIFPHLLFSSSPISFTSPYIFFVALPLLSSHIVPYTYYSQTGK